jgi:hypothetical protein
MSKRIYTEDEVSRLIRRAVELEAERSVLKGDHSRAGLSITELEQIAAESGIDPELIHQASKELDTGRTKFDSAKDEKAIVKKEEIVCERWIDVQPDSKIFDDLVTELNHKYGTSDKDINWWDQLWENYAGKARVRKTTTSLEWHYTDDFDFYTTRVLLQIRGERFRIRVSKRQKWGMRWNTGDSFYWTWIVIPFLTVFSVMGGILSANIIDNVWPGIAAGALLAISIYPIVKLFTQRSLKKHREQVTDTANELSELAIQLVDEPRSDVQYKKRTKTGEAKTIEIEYSDVHDESKNGTGRLRNNLKDIRK